ncbi:MAG: hypothetical protein J6W57_07425 [Oscillospiraceae bacterium]|nr:hypothetical protein [Oscillospiraceae bacterium]MBP1555049.1 hypothetical protein [Oscillospiraceae bacterium]MBQ5341814.1 hypothetical protein [Oscillospiraceae bacterium]MBQ5342742.1 hypothetical protein [Oscillospiraceae bacterium]
MKHLIYEFLCLSTLICILLSMSGCSQKPVPDHESGNTEAPVTEDGSVQGPEDSVYDWEEIGENGVDEEMLMENTDTETLTYVAKELQDVCAAIDRKGEEDREYWLTGQWYSNALGSEQYREVVSLGRKAMRPLFLIVYKSENAGMYEWICCKALEEISGIDLSGENGGAGWRDSKEFLKLFIVRVSKHS